MSSSPVDFIHSFKSDVIHEFGALSKAYLTFPLFQYRMMHGFREKNRAVARRGQTVPLPRSASAVDTTHENLLRIFKTLVARRQLSVDARLFMSPLTPRQLRVKEATTASPDDRRRRHREDDTNARWPMFRRLWNIFGAGAGAGAGAGSTTTPYVAAADPRSPSADAALNTLSCAFVVDFCTWRQELGEEETKEMYDTLWNDANDLVYYLEKQSLGKAVYEINPVLRHIRFLLALRKHYEEFPENVFAPAAPPAVATPVGVVADAAAAGPAAATADADAAAAAAAAAPPMPPKVGGVGNENEKRPAFPQPRLRRSFPVSTPVPGRGSVETNFRDANAVAKIERQRLIEIARDAYVFSEQAYSLARITCVADLQNRIMTCAEDDVFNEENATRPVYVPHRNTFDSATVWVLFLNFMHSMFVRTRKHFRLVLVTRNRQFLQFLAEYFPHSIFTGQTPAAAADAAATRLNAHSDTSAQISVFLSENAQNTFRVVLLEAHLDRFKKERLADVYLRRSVLRTSEGWLSLLASEREAAMQAFQIRFPRRNERSVHRTSVATQRSAHVAGLVRPRRGTVKRRQPLGASASGVTSAASSALDARAAPAPVPGESVRRIAPTKHDRLARSGGTTATS